MSLIDKNAILSLVSTLDVVSAAYAKCTIMVMNHWNGTSSPEGCGR